MKIKTIIIDDNEIWRETIAKFINMNQLLELVGTYDSVTAAYPDLVQNKIDLVFSDIDMPDANGVDFFKGLQRHPMLIFVTAHPGYAIESYETNAIDFLVKPFSVERFFKAVEKARMVFKIIDSGKKITEVAPVEDNYFFVRANNAYQKIMYDEVLYIKSMENFVQIKTKTDNITTLVSLKNMMLQLPQTQFRQVHRGYVINIFEVKAIDKEQVFVGTQSVPLGDNYKEALIETLVEHKLIKR